MKLDPASRKFGLDDPAAYFDLKSDEGYEAIKAARSEQLKDAQAQRARMKRTWGVVEAARMVGRTRQWVQSKGGGDSVNESGNQRYSLERINELRKMANTLYQRPKNSKPFIIALSKLKGGVGNTTLTVHLAHYLAMQGLKVLCVDFDLQASTTMILGNVNPEVDLSEEDCPNYSLTSDIESYADIIRPTYFHNVWLAPCNASLMDLEMSLTQEVERDSDEYLQDKAGNPIYPYNRLEYAIEAVKGDYDVILIDCAPSLGILTGNALTVADSLINPLKPSAMDRASYSMFNASMSSFYDALESKTLRYFRVAITQWAASKSTDEEEKKLREWHTDYVLSHNIKHNAEIKNAPSQMSTVYELEEPISNRETYNKALKTLNGACGEIYDDLRAIWEMESV